MHLHCFSSLPLEQLAYLTFGSVVVADLNISLRSSCRIRPSVWKVLNLADDGSPLPDEAGAASAAATTGLAARSEGDDSAGAGDSQDGSKDGDSPDDQTVPADDGIPPGVAS